MYFYMLVLSIFFNIRNLNIWQIHFCRWKVFLLIRYFCMKELKQKMTMDLKILGDRSVMFRKKQVVWIQSN